jgi:poly-D-alanine transfer protein DltD
LSVSAGEGDDRYVVVFKKGSQPPEVQEAAAEEEMAAALNQAEIVKAELLAKHAAEEARRMREESLVRGEAIVSAKGVAASKSIAESATDVVKVERAFAARDKRTISEIQEENRAKRMRMTDGSDE